MPADAATDIGQGPVRVTVLGATGSIGQSLADLLERNPDRFDVVALVANRNADGLAEMAIKLKASIAVLAETENYQLLADRLSGTGIRAASGQAAIAEAVDLEADLVVGAIVGAAGLAPTFRAIKPGRRIALANKECLVCAGDLFVDRVREAEAELLPVDSEHNAIFQVFEKDQADQIEKVILTASGGPFRTWPIEKMQSVTPAQALRHPNWDMGSRITIDSATMMNKGFEVIEASHLFPVENDQLDVLVHPQSTVHGLVQYKDGSLLAQLGSPDMRTPIAHCLSFPKRMPVPVKRLNLAELGTLTFEAPDHVRFPCLGLALQALDAGGGAPAALNAADEVAVQAFLNGRIGFLDIPAAIEAVLDRLSASDLLKPSKCVEDVLDLDSEARQKTLEWVESRTSWH
ncbi:1-deoxy-D-xylulose-5-phosphate reductoisomerase [Roseibium sp.]|uniref:1-deoxy-D-xylulose-5-phosphate reductoisomerase n=1 Tax=Roseibium sp. TaxID=1936156 RepID=UPI003BA8BF44